MKMIKKFIVVVTLLITAFSWAQDNTSSPYSYYGSGEIKFRGTQDTKSMGDLNIVGDSIHLNLMNPASYSRLKITTFAIGGTGNFNQLDTETGTEKAQRTTLDYLAMGIPLGKFGVSFGITPYSAVGYKIQNYSTTANIARANFYSGEGNVNRVFFGAGYNLTKKLSAGLNFSYHFGQIETEAVEFIVDPAVQLGSRERNTSNIKGISTSLGLLYNTKINTKLDLFTSFNYRPESKLNTENDRNIATIQYNINGNEIVGDEEDIAVADTKMVIPSQFSFGAGIGRDKKWLIGTELTFTENSNLTNRFADIVGSTFENSTKLSVGGFFIPKYDSFSSYLSRVVYRAGFRYENTGLVLKNKSINDYGMNFGLGLPVGVSQINLGFEFGKRGTIYSGLIEENYFNLSVGLSLNDIWFKKRKID
ncbi:hypothetical protein [Flavobacterium psychraquaticum]|uniref:hypothetical protein n=1 Tax=Flavobacterium psychraquaticum TaxID=3103958 RepID=UPI002ACD9557|nr:hypothetical protein [Flavobacterium sp. LB-N7T]